MEELKQILATLSTMGDLGRDMFIWWLIMDKLVYVISWLVTLAMLMAGMKYLLDNGVFWGVDERAFREIRDMLQVGSPGAVTQSELVEMRDRIARLMKAYHKDL